MLTWKSFSNRRHPCKFGKLLWFDDYFVNVNSLFLYTNRFTNLIEIASQVAEAMQDLHSRGFIHRDLAARNCLIYTSNMKVKICDNGAFIGEYKKEYYNEVLPVRWMSHESILQGKFTSKSDVFSFGVTLWEIMNYCKMLPHEQLSESELLAEIISENKAEMDVSVSFYCVCMF